MRIRLLTPVAVAATLVAATAFVHAGFPGFRDPPRLPGITPLQLALKIGSLDSVRFSGTVKLDMDLGLPRLPKLGTSGGADPVRLLSGSHVLQVATDTTGGAQRQRVALIDTFSEYDAVRDGTDLWLWDSTRQLARHGSVDALASALLAFATPSELVRSFAGPATIQTALFDTALSVRETVRVAGRDCYVLRIEPRVPGTTVGSVRVAVDAATGMPLSVAVYPVGSSSPAISAAFTSLRFSAPDAEFRFAAPPGSRVLEEHAPQVTAKPYRGVGTSWTAAVEVPGFDPQGIIAGLGTAPGDAGGGEPSGTAAVLAALAGTPGTPLQSYLRMMLAAGQKTPAGLVWSSRLVSAVFTPDHRFYVAFSTPGVLEETVERDLGHSGR